MTAASTPGPAISGTTRVYALLGDPIAQVRAPGLLHPLLARRGIDAVFVPMQVAASDVAPVVRALRQVVNLHGVLVTVPHKAAALALADRVTARAGLAGSVNALRREPDGTWSADTFDGDGFVRGLVETGYDPRGLRVCVVGAGGAGSAIAVALLDAEVAEVRLVDTDAGRLDTLCQRLSAAYPGRVTAATEPHLADVDIAVNATPLGLRPDDPLPFPVTGLPAHAVVADIIMKPAETALLRAADERGLTAHPGEPMLNHQLDSYLAFFAL
ncbi:shikimate dehydrogenase family protein [Salinispora arenicola]|uniref:Shikimate dehydrogenase n=1 Tax=Salinispora arenicola TaxID=168697 RepID=A0A542XVC7_SALAC|nr:shikimate dehydrogenase [Salinispora arenicola]MCN0153463.1 shikimate dehydrogenase [Salinispora arenicola]TQL39794.1 shikimate dehydrogenase [Salinispora arenicola]GIM81051.1 shikimate dehydrogenase [Salinispora arenicola]